MKKFLYILSMCLLVSCGKAEQSDTLDGDIKFNRLPLEYSEEATAVTLEDYYVENVEKYYTSTFSINTEATLIKKIPSLEDISTIEDIHSVVDTPLRDITDDLEMSGQFTNVSIEDYGNLVQLACLSEDKLRQLTVNFRTDRICQILYYVKWGSNNDIDLSDTLAFIDSYLGLKLVEDDVYHLNNIIMEGAEQGGKYTVYVNDKWSYNYYALSVSDFDTGAESWEFYVSVAE